MQAMVNTTIFKSAALCFQRKNFFIFYVINITRLVDNRCVLATARITRDLAERFDEDLNLTSTQARQKLQLAAQRVSLNILLDILTPSKGLGISAF